MKTLSVLMAVLVPTTSFASHFAPDNSGLLVWSFLGMCSLVVLSQLIPAMMVVVGTIKGFATEVKQVG